MSTESPILYLEDPQEAKQADSLEAFRSLPVNVQNVVNSAAKQEKIFGVDDLRTMSNHHIRRYVRPSHANGIGRRGLKAFRELYPSMQGPFEYVILDL